MGPDRKGKLDPERVRPPERRRGLKVLRPSQYADVESVGMFGVALFVLFVLLLTYRRCSGHHF